LKFQNVLGCGCKGHDVEEYFADLIVKDEIVLELKCVDRLLKEHTAQCLNYLKAPRELLKTWIGDCGNNFQKHYLAKAQSRKENQGARFLCGLASSRDNCVSFFTRGGWLPIYRLK
jgi:hypothetical protein